MPSHSSHLRTLVFLLLTAFFGTSVSYAQDPPVAGFSGTPLSGNAPLDVQFTNESTGNFTTGTYDFGDGNMATNVPNPLHTYTTPGLYTVSLTVTGPGGSDTLTRVDYVNVADPTGPPMAAFSGTPLSGSAPLDVQFTDNSTGDVTSWSWDFGDTNSSTEQNPSHQYVAEGLYTVSLTVMGPGGSDALTEVDYVDVSSGVPPPVAAFSGTPVSGDAPLDVQFTNESTGNFTTGTYDFGDGNMAVNVPNPLHTYVSAGVYTVSLTVTGPGGSDTQTRVDYITVTDPVVPPVAAFSGTPLSGDAPLSVDFTDASTGTVTSWMWDFGDTNMSTEQNPTHLYNDAGTYTVSLTVTGPGGSDTLTETDYVTVTDPVVPPVAAFSGTPLSGDAPLSVDFTDASTGTITSWMWDFGDTNMSTEQNPTHLYNDAGTYTVSLTVTGPGGSDTLTETDYVTVTDPVVPPVAAFSGTPLSGDAPLSVDFTDASTGTITSWMWDFGDTNMSTEQNPTHLYNDAGTYTVSLTVTGPGGSDTLTETDYVTVTDPVVPPVAAFSGTPLSGDAPLSVDFTDASTGTITSWMWDFGDTNMSTEQNPTHLYNDAGTYTVSLTVTGPGGSDTLTETDYVTVNAPTAPVAAFSGAPLSGNVPLSVDFTDASTGTVTSWMWDFGDTNMSTEQNPTHLYDTPGTYTVSLTVTGPGGSDTQTEVDYISVLDPPVAAFSATRLTGNAPLIVQFTDASTGAITSYSWDFGDTHTSTDPNPTNVYTVPGTYTVSLTVSGPDGESTSTAVDLITVDPGRSLGHEDRTPLDGGTVIIGGSFLPGLVVAGEGGLHGTVETPLSLAEGGFEGRATPPTHPGAAGLPPVGAAGIAQSFRFDPMRPQLYFHAAFLLGGPERAASQNDFMSVDLIDGTTTLNLYYADSFSDFPDTSTKYGLPMTAVDTVVVDILELFPDADAGQEFTITIQVGNANNGSGSSKGLVDGFAFAPHATATVRNGSGSNASCLSSTTRPSLGATWTTRVAHGMHPGAAFTVLRIGAHPAEGAPTRYGEVLISGSRYFRSTVVSSGTFDTHSIDIPLELGLVGLQASAQAVILGGTGPELCNAVDIRTSF